MKSFIFFTAWLQIQKPMRKYSHHGGMLPEPAPNANHFGNANRRTPAARMNPFQAFTFGLSDVDILIASPAGCFTMPGPTDAKRSGHVPEIRRAETSSGGLGQRTSLHR
jgi:hypothetical protein